MKTLVTAILVAACIGLVIALVVQEKQGGQEKKKDTDTILDFSNQWVAASDELTDQRQVNLMLTNDLNAGREALLVLSNQYLAASDSLSNSQSQLKTAQDQITDLEAQNQALDQRAAEMTNTIADLDAQIADTQTKLVTAETNNVFLQDELKQQVAKKDELEHKFNTLTVVRTQVKKLRDDLVVARRLEWTREGRDPAVQQKGAQVLMARTPMTNRLVTPPHYDLNVEVGADGSVHVIPALTNAPVMTNSPQ